MTECRWATGDGPRIIPGRHDPECADTTCRGCQPCRERHCINCGIVHCEHVCPGCLLAVKLDLTEVVESYQQIESEIADHGINSEAMAIIGPCADPEARGHLEASVTVGRVDPDRLEDALPRDEKHPLWVLENIAMDWRVALDHDDPSTRATVPDSAGYLIRNIGHAATKPAVNIAAQAVEIAACLGNLGSVLQKWRTKHKGAPCIHCNDGTLLERQTRDDEDADGWWCPACRWEWDEDGYREVVAAGNRSRSAWLTGPDCAEVTGANVASIWKWAERGRVTRKTIGGKVHYNRAQVEEASRASAQP